MMAHSVDPLAVTGDDVRIYKKTLQKAGALHSIGNLFLALKSDRSRSFDHSSDELLSNTGSSHPE